MSRVTAAPAKPATPAMPASTTQVPHEKIAMRAYEKWCRRGRPHGSSVNDWLEAEKELKAECTKGKK